VNLVFAAPTPGILPDLLHQTAFNLCAALADSWGGPVHLRSADPFYAAELTMRLESLSQPGRGRRRPMLLWAGPSLADLPEVAGLLDAFPPESAVLLLYPRRRGRAFVSHPPVAPDMPRAGAAGVENRPPGLKDILAWLAPQGFREEAWYGIGGSEYRFWSRLAYLMECLGRADQADRFRARARAVLLTKGNGAASAVLTLILTVRRNG
jgi:hypothetical protein